METTLLMSRTPADIQRLTASKATLATALDVSESTVEELVRRGVLPKPLKLTPGCVRWSWAAVERALASLAGTSDDAADPFMTGARNAAKTSSEGRRGTT
jgi:predicted DNA-binding transcriptional regulator AlpA